MNGMRKPRNSCLKSNSLFVGVQLQPKNEVKSQG